jgi:hypothetical protein
MHKKLEHKSISQTHLYNFGYINQREQNTSINNVCKG